MGEWTGGELADLAAAIRAGKLHGQAYLYGKNIVFVSLTVRLDEDEAELLKELVDGR